MESQDNNDRQVEDVLTEIEDFMRSQGVHIKIAFDQEDASDDELLEKTVTKTNSSDCSTGDCACDEPTLHQGLDRTE